MERGVSDGDKQEPGQTEANAGNGARPFKNSDAYLKKSVPQVVGERKALGLDGLVGGLEFVRINVEHGNLASAAGELLVNTGYDVAEAFEGKSGSTCVLRRRGSADIILTNRAKGKNPFAPYNKAPKSAHLPSTRLEAFGFATKDVDRYFEIQSGRGVRFTSDEPADAGDCVFVETVPSKCTGASVAVARRKRGGSYRGADDRELDIGLDKPDASHLKNIGFLDHTATRVRAADRDEAILDFMRLTNFDFQFAIYVERLNSITNVARLAEGEFAMVFTSGIKPYRKGEVPGPTENFINNYGTRVHHMAFSTEKIDETFEALKAGGMKFLSKLLGSPAEGLKQTFSAHSPRTLLVNEYIHRYGGFAGFFTQSNPTELTRGTGKQ